MNVIKSNKELSTKEQYFLTMSPEVQKMKDAVSQVIEIKNFCVYEDVNSKSEQQEILAISTPENEIFATNSPTFKEDFLKMHDLFGAELKAIKVVSGQSKAGREFITCVYEDMEGTNA